MTPSIHFFSSLLQQVSLSLHPFFPLDTLTGAPPCWYDGRWTGVIGEEGPPPRESSAQGHWSRITFSSVRVIIVFVLCGELYDIRQRTGIFFYVSPWGRLTRCLIFYFAQTVIFFFSLSLSLRGILYEYYCSILRLKLKLMHLFVIIDALILIALRRELFLNG